ncbi:MAG: ABC transporter permease [Verrucomicrobiota bacterium]
MSTPIPLPKRSAWASQVLVIKALFKREITTRFGEYQLGFFWMLLEPLLSVLVIGFLVGSFGGRAVPEIPYPFFVLNGKLLLNLFTGPLSSSMNAMKANRGLMIYPNVRALDPFIARFVYELITTLFSFTIFCVVGMWMGIQVSLGSLDNLAACYLITWLMGCGLGLILAVASAHYKEVEKIVDVILSPLMFVSAVMFPISALPTSLQNILLFNPLVHVIELSRKALFPFYYAEGADLFFPFAVAIVVVALGLMLFHSNRNFLSQQT